tara:strand:+ start:397 stop:642 length:246 start_codon:yes stop_codon:yes gene_type:complete
MQANLEDKVKFILMSILQIEENRVLIAKRGTTSSWDSMAWVNIISAIEDEFGIELNEEDYELVSSFELICELVKVKLKGGV